LQAKREHMEADQDKLFCIRCGRPMRFARSILRPAKLPKLETFECSYCGLAITAEGAAELLKNAVQFVPW
jgi:DNA-directed RNA polymerase subunit RPC12/RpoP